MIGGGLAVARYDSRDGYGGHPARGRLRRPRQAATPDRGCGGPSRRTRRPASPTVPPCGPPAWRRSMPATGASTRSSTPTVTASAASAGPDPRRPPALHAAESSTERLSTSTGADTARCADRQAPATARSSRGAMVLSPDAQVDDRVGRAAAAAGRRRRRPTPGRAVRRTLGHPVGEAARRVSTSVGGPSAGCGGHDVTHTAGGVELGDPLEGVRHAGRRPRASSPALGAASAKSTPRHVPARCGCRRTGVVASSARTRRSRRAWRRGRARSWPSSTAPCSDGDGDGRGRPPTAHDQGSPAVVGRDAPDLGGGRPVVRRPLGREDDARRDREAGGTGGGEVGGLATHPRHVERGWVIQRDDGCGGAHVADGAGRRHVAGLRRA